DRRALHDGDPYVAHQKELLSCYRERVIPAGVNLFGVQDVREQPCGPLKILHHQRNVTDALNAHSHSLHKCSTSITIRAPADMQLRASWTWSRPVIMDGTSPFSSERSFEGDFSTR